MLVPYVGVGEDSIIRSGPGPVNVPGRTDALRSRQQRRWRGFPFPGNFRARPTLNRAAPPAAGAAARMGENELDLELVKRVQRGEKEAEDAEHFGGSTRMHDNDTPEHELLREEIAREVSETVAALPEELRQAITLREMEGLSYEEIAETMDCPIGTVRSRIFRAREAIDARLRPLMDSERVRP